uniref:Uncharacterized protein n=1 Tax=Rhizophora mucronata TaxID=61149 RepID=A0A2P2P7R0_RHIMU
MGGRLWFYRST